MKAEILQQPAACGKRGNFAEILANTPSFRPLSITKCESVYSDLIPYTFSVTLQGIVLALPEGERLERAVKANAPAMLFGAAREMIHALTSRGPHRAIIIPSTNFLPPALPESPVPQKDKFAKKTMWKGD